MQQSSRVNQVTEICDDPKPGECGDPLFAQWGFNADELYKIALQFFRDKGRSKAVEISYKERLHLLALSRQVSFGKFQSQLATDTGLFDVVGNDRKLAWQKLGDMPKETAMVEFISALNALCPLFAPYVTAHKVEKEEQERKKKEAEEELERLKRQQVEEEEMKMEEERRRQMNQEIMIRNALNQQTASQFRFYAEQQFPGNKAEQDNLIAQLQEQHYAQYMMQVYNQQHWSSLPPGSQASTPPVSFVSSAPLMSPKGVTTAPRFSSGTSPQNSVTQSPANLTHTPTNHMESSSLPNGVGSQDSNKNIIDKPNHVSSDLLPDGKPEIESASLWTRRDIKQFKDSLRGEVESSVTVKSGETVTVRIPTHKDGACLFWEFATDSYDIGFGVSFEWSDVSTDQMRVEVRSSDLQEDKSEPQWKRTPPADVIIPVYRRDSHAEVYCGSHVYPGHGVYLFIFDNSYSLWRSKTVFYRVYYTG